MPLRDTEGLEGGPGKIPLPNPLSPGSLLQKVGVGSEIFSKNELEVD